MAEGYKIIHDPVHGSIRADGVLLDLVESPTFQRLQGVHQLGLAYLVFPGARHTRFDHSIGTAHIADRMADSLDLADRERDRLLAAAALHDVGHLPYSHTVESLYESRFGPNHVDLSQRIIEGRLDVADADGATVPEILETHGLDPAGIANLVRGGFEPLHDVEEITSSQKPLSGERTVLSDLVSGPADCDRLDFLLRDSYYTGVAHGTIDLDRLVQTVTVHAGRLVVDRKGVSSVEGMLAARSLMYQAVYHHKTVRIASLLLTRAAERLDEDALEDLPGLVDRELLSRLEQAGGFPAEVVRRLKYRRLYKSAYMLDVDDLDDDRRKALLGLDEARKVRRKERELANRTGLDPEEVILDIPARQLLQREPTVDRTDVPILDDGRVRPLSRYTPVARALSARRVPDFACLVACPPRARDEVRRAAETVLFG